MPVKKYRRHSDVPFEGVEWTGDNIDEIWNFTGKDNFQVFTDNEGLPFDAAVWDKLHDTWINVEPGHTIMKGLQGEFWPIKTLEGSYVDWVDEDTTWQPVSPWMTAEPGSKVILFGDAYPPAYEGDLSNRTDEVLEAVQRWAPELEWFYVADSGIHGAIHVPPPPSRLIPGVESCAEMDEKPL